VIAITNGRDECHGCRLALFCINKNELPEVTMYATFQAATPEKRVATNTMRALVFRGPNQIGIERVSIPRPEPGEAVIRITLTTICGTDLHILKGE